MGGGGGRTPTSDEVPRTRRDFCRAQPLRRRRRRRGRRRVALEQPCRLVAVHGGGRRVNRRAGCVRRGDADPVSRIQPPCPAPPAPDTRWAARTAPSGRQATKGGLAPPCAGSWCSGGGFVRSQGVWRRAGGWGMYIPRIGYMYHIRAASPSSAHTLDRPVAQRARQEVLTNLILKAAPSRGAGGA